jgi:hypothetical protein
LEFSEKFLGRSIYSFPYFFIVFHSFPSKVHVNPCNIMKINRKSKYSHVTQCKSVKTHRITIRIEQNPHKIPTTFNHFVVVVLDADWQHRISCGAIHIKSLRDSDKIVPFEFLTSLQNSKIVDQCSIFTPLPMRGACLPAGRGPGEGR